MLDIERISRQRGNQANEIDEDYIARNTKYLEIGKYKHEIRPDLNDSADNIGLSSQAPYMLSRSVESDNSLVGCHEETWADKFWSF